MAYIKVDQSMLEDSGFDILIDLQSRMLSLAPQIGAEIDRRVLEGHDPTVYISTKGKRYHKVPGCGGAWHGAPLSMVGSRRPCRICYPERRGI